MAKKRGRKDAYTGRSGQRAVMAELLFRRCNTAIPEVDVGEDLFAFRDGEEAVARIQVKTATAHPLKTAAGYTAQFNLPLHQLAEVDFPRLYYVLPIRLQARWEDFLIIRRLDLNELRVTEGLGLVAEGFLKLDLSFRPDDVRCSGVSLQRYRNAWEMLPPLQPPGPGAAPTHAQPPGAAG